MGFFKFITIVGVAASVMQPTYSASIGNACICDKVYEPLCGSDGVTYSNHCEFNCAKKLNRNLKIFKRGECPENYNLPICACPFTYLPLCGSDGQTYSNECEIKCAMKINRNLEIYKKGECVEVQPINDAAAVGACTFIYSPVCGSDGQTYSNECLFNYAKKFNRNLEIFKEGECVEVQPFNDAADVCVCPFNYLPLCGSDGQTYSNECEINCAKKYNRNLEIFKEGECDEDVIPM